MAKIYNFDTIECIKDNQLRSIEEINTEVYNLVIKKL